MTFTPAPPMTDNINSPSHYTEGRQFETIAVIEDWALGYHLGNAVKYLSRAGRKDPTKTIEDLKKARWYVEREIERLEAADVPFDASFDEQEELEFRAMGELAELGTVSFGSDEDGIVSFEFNGGHGSFMSTKDDLWDPSCGPVEPEGPSFTLDVAPPAQTKRDYQGPLYARHPDLVRKDREQFEPGEIITTREINGQILGIQKNGDVAILKHAEHLYEELDLYAETEL